MYGHFGEKLQVHHLKTFFFCLTGCRAHFLLTRVLIPKHIGYLYLLTVSVVAISNVSRKKWNTIQVKI